MPRDGSSECSIPTPHKKHSWWDTSTNPATRVTCDGER